MVELIYFYAYINATITIKEKELINLKTSGNVGTRELLEEWKTELNNIVRYEIL